jgi:hypothetical protein
MLPVHYIMSFSMGSTEMKNVRLYHEVYFVDVIHGDLEAHQVEILESIVIVQI